jgi:hypothetical protein
MTKGQKIAVIVTAVSVSVIAGGLLYMYFNRKSLLDKIKRGDMIEYEPTRDVKSYFPDSDSAKTAKYGLKRFTGWKADYGVVVGLFQINQEGMFKNQPLPIGVYHFKDDQVVFTDYKDKGKTERVTDKKEQRLLKYLLKNLI